ncbi:MAG TPA: tetratricopeptide repeat protein, partial [Crenotrichaceae bacterium]|nr:tetratricopeptide repeat protein [Crenotrichaceae bacterium]
MLQLTRVLLSLIIITGVSSVFADDSCGEQAARITSIQGTVKIRRSTSLEWLPANLNDSLCGNDAVRTAAHSRATLLVQKETNIVLHERSTVRFTNGQPGKNGLLTHLLNLFSGEAYLRSRRPRELGIETPFVNAMHEGTEFLVKVNQNSTQVVVFDGVVVASNSQGKLSISEGQSALAMQGQAPVIGPTIDLRDAVQWTLYYPPVIDYTASQKSPSYQTLKPALDRYQTNDLTGAIAKLNSLSATQRTADYHILYASLLLTVGQVEQANQHLDQAQQQTGQNARILAIRSIIALAKNDQQQALKLAQQAQQLNPKASSANIALSYAYQSLFDIDKALESATQAAQSAPDNGLAWARVSEMELATGDVDASMQAARKAQTHNPKLAKTNTVLGFARLAELDLSDAEQSFRTAIERDPSDPLARLGLGLAKIRQGHIKSGTREMETAANLDPDNALIRSYLGKAYYEQRRGDIASTEYAIAKQLDPKDPTPWFYDAIYKQTVNRPVDALHDMQKAIELNDNRAVFRSRLLLDSDLAARNTGLARAYTETGFDQAASQEAYNALIYDPTSWSAHRFLSDSLAKTPR